MNKKTLFLRIIVSPFVLGILAVTYAYEFVKHFIAFMRWGGELITYKKEDQKRIGDIFDLLKEKGDNIL